MVGHSDIGWKRRSGNLGLPRRHERCGLRKRHSLLRHLAPGRCGRQTAQLPELQTLQSDGAATAAKQCDGPTKSQAHPTYTPAEEVGPSKWATTVWRTAGPGADFPSLQ